MRKFWLLCAALFSPHMAMARPPDAPFTPVPDVPDYVATVFVKPYRGPPLQEMHTHHGGWTRVDHRFDQNAYHSTTYFGPGPLFVTFARESPPRVGGHDQLHILRGPAMAHLIRWSDHPFKTGEAQTWLGESCDVWNLPSKRLIGRDAKRLSCVTPDGIELWSRVENHISPTTSLETTAINRLPVKPDDVRPHRDQLDLKSWLTEPRETARPSNAPGDVTVVMRSVLAPSTDRHIQTRTVRRHYPWTYTEDVDGKGGRRLRFVNEVERLDIAFEHNAAGEPIRLSIQKALRDYVRQKPPDSGRTETILGEQCQVTERQSRHGRSSQCRTADGLALMDSERGWPDHDLVAVTLDRSPVDLDTVLPPPALFARAAWGIPD
ncbi:hypothetical protein [Bradyrhizobium sp. OAE829]|uniref:hypothetical protein n=1 Tax=Bradyrhizobium sp. OAE829 TaxID=2663807 RepID=UPI0017894C88